VDWQPSAGLETLRARAELLGRIRDFFAARDVLEVETPLLCNTGVTDPSIEPLTVEHGSSVSQPRFLQTSPEYAMKRLLAGHGQPIFQLAKAFRDGEAGARHNPEFTLLEWYRPGFDHHELMAEVGELVSHCIGQRPLQRYSYRQLFHELLSVDPFTATAAELQAQAQARLDTGGMTGDKDLWLDLLMSHIVEPKLAARGMCFVYDYPASQAALAQVSEVDGVMVGHRFELYVDGLELANGYFELTDPAEQHRRFTRDNSLRRERGLAERSLDKRQLAAMEQGLPQCSGVALGVDRLLMLATGHANIRDVLAFDWVRA
jgi:lysyl-tRNA synthetase class 2